MNQHPALALLLLGLAWPAIALPQARTSHTVADPSAGSSTKGPPVALAAKASGGVTGHVYVTLRDGSSQILRGEEIALLCGGAMVNQHITVLDNRMRAVGNAVRQTLANMVQGSPTAGGQYLGAIGFSSTFLPRLAEAYGKGLLRNALRSQRTTFEGAFHFDSIPAGDYILVAQYRTDEALGYWHVPVTVRDSSTATVDLATFNLFDLGSALGMDRIKEGEQLALNAMARDASIAHALPSETALGQAFEQQRAAGLQASMPPELIDSIGDRSCSLSQ